MPPASVPSTAIATPNSAICSPMFLNAAGEIYRGRRRCLHQLSGGRSPAPRWACPAPSTSSTIPTSAASCAAINSSIRFPRASAQAMLDKHITRLVKSESGEARFETITMSRTSSSWRAAAAHSIWKRNSEFPPSAWPPSIVSPNWRSPRASTPCAMPAFRWSCATRPPAKARSCRTAGDCPTHCATTPA